MAHTSRRDLLGAGAVSALLGGVSSMVGFAAASLPIPDAQAADALPAEPHPDAELIGLCDQMLELERQWGEESEKNADRHPNDPAYKVCQAEQDRLSALQNPIADRLYELDTHTLEGFRARARAIMAADYGEMERQQDHRGQIYSLMRDLIGEAI